MQKIMTAILLFLLIFATSIHAANNKKQKKTNNVTAFATTKLDLDAEMLPEGYRGHSLFDIFSNFKAPAQKGEFEKTSEYETRVNTWKNAKLLGDLKYGDTFAFGIFSDNKSIKYNADTEELEILIYLTPHTLSLETGGGNFYGIRDVRWLEMIYNSQNFGSRVAQTRMGIKTRVNSWGRYSVGVGLTDSSESIIKFSTKMSSLDARLAKPFIAIFAIVNITEPLKINDTKTTAATLDDPDEIVAFYNGFLVDLKSIWVVNSLTGKIITKVNYNPTRDKPIKIYR